MRSLRLAFVWLLAAGVKAGGFIGHGIEMYQPPCAYGCQSSISAPLMCAVAEDTNMGEDVMMDPTPECKADNSFYLHTLAFCIQSHCEDVSVSELEAFWACEVMEDHPNQSLPAGGYLQTLASIVEPPTRTLNNSILLNYTAKVDPDQWLSNYNALGNLAVAETTNARYGFVVFLTGVAIPISFSLLRFLPWPALFVAKFKAYLIDPPLVGSKHASPVWGFAIMPTRGQALFIAYIWLINILLSAVGHKAFWPHSWCNDRSQEVETYIAHRLGILSVANLSLLILYAGRNNILLWLTNWSRSTFLLLHRWIAFICMLQAVIHTLFHLHIYSYFPSDYYHWERGVPYWYWGIIATLAMAIIVPFSIQPIRHRVYEAFLVSHIALSILTLTAVYLHLYFRFDNNWGHENWLHLAMAIWVFDRVIRLVRSAVRGVKRAYITDIDEDYVRIDIPGVTATGHVYLHFPTVSTWRIWENHPFSVAGVTRFLGPEPEPVDVAPDENRLAVVVKSLAKSSADLASLEAPPAPELSTVLLVRRYGGITSLLSAKSAGKAGLPVLVEGSYDRGETFFQDGHVGQSHSFPNVICIAGGVGITGVLQVLEHCRGVGGNVVGSKKLYWGVRTMPLVHAVEDILGYDHAEATSRHWGDVEVYLSVGQRLNLRYLLGADLRSHVGGTTVVICGPGDMADDVRSIVSEFSRRGGPDGATLVRLVVESFTW